MLDPGDARQRILDAPRDLGFKLSRCGPRERQAHVDRGHVDVRQILDSKLVEPPDAGERQKDEQQDRWNRIADRSEEHTSELQSLMRISYAVFCLKKKKKEKDQN